MSAGKTRSGVGSPEVPTDFTGLVAQASRVIVPLVAMSLETTQVTELIVACLGLRAPVVIFRKKITGLSLSLNLYSNN